MNAPGVEDELKGGRDDPELDGTWVEETKGRLEHHLETWELRAGKIRPSPKRGDSPDWTYQVDAGNAGKQPNAINITWDDGSIRRGIYKIEDDLLTLCISMRSTDFGGPDAQRPKEFVAQPNKVEIRTFRRKM
jgi:hypothetical protein